MFKPILEHDATRTALQAHIFSVLRTLKKVNLGDMYYEAYRGHFDNWGEEFTDIYMVQCMIGKWIKPKRILEIGTRTGISLCQLLSGYLVPEEIERIDCIDPFNDGFISPNIVLRNLRYLNLPDTGINFHEDYSQNVLPKMLQEGKTFDYILVDGDHSHDAALHDLSYAENLIEVNGIILFDDISDAPGECGLIEVWEKWKSLERTKKFHFDHDIHGKGVAWAVRYE